MKVWRVYNGWYGFCAVHKIVVADTKEEAIKKSRATFKEQPSDGEFVAEEVEMINGVETEDYDG